MKTVPSAVYKRKSTDKVILKYLDFLYMDKEVKSAYPYNPRFRSKV